MFKNYDDVSAAIDLRSGEGEWPWCVLTGTRGYVLAMLAGDGIEVRFENGVVRVCGAHELALAGGE